LEPFSAPASQPPRLGTIYAFSPMPASVLKPSPSFGSV
jgi:hypothetical protein